MPGRDLATGGSHAPAAESVLLPALRWDVAFRLRHDGTGVFSDADAEYEFGGVSGYFLRNFAAYLDGRHSRSSAARALGASEALITNVAGLLVRHDLAVELTEALDEDISHEKFSAVCRRHFPVWKERLFGHQLWQRLCAGEASRPQFLGWLIESYHFIEGVNDRLALAVSECYDHRVRPLFARHFTEEYDHGHFFAKALAAFGYDERTVSSARPLPSTLAILHFMRQCARRDPLHYAVCSGFLESTGGDRLRARDFYARLAESYEADRPGAVKPLLDHVNLDEAYGHNNMMEAITERLVRIPIERASAALTAGALLVETLELWSTDILRTYDRPDFIPRTGPAQYRPASAASPQA
jgi:hypothetical protein